MRKDRRWVLKSSLTAAVFAAAVGDVWGQSKPTNHRIACRGRKVASAKRDAWTPHIPPLAKGGIFDLSTTLPPHVPSGGRFQIDASGAQLPAGMHLSESGFLSVGTTGAGQVIGVIFAYDAPHVESN